MTQKDVGGAELVGTNVLMYMLVMAVFKSQQRFGNRNLMYLPV